MRKGNLEFLFLYRKSVLGAFAARYFRTRLMISLQI